MTMKYDASGYATKNNLKCSDGRTILKDAFKDQDGITVPLVWQHLHNTPDNILGHALLENRDDGVYTYLKFNSTPNGLSAKKLVEEGDITYLSIYANNLLEKSKRVEHGAIREVSLVLTGANPGAKIDNLAIAHADGSEDTIVEDEAIIFTDAAISLPEPAKVKELAKEIVKEVVKTSEEVTHADSASTPASDGGDETVEDVFNTLSDKQKQVVYALIAEVVDSASTDNTDSSMSQSDEGDNETMKKNVFDKNTDTVEDERPSLTHAQFSEILTDAQKNGSLKQAFTNFIQHTASLGYGIDDIDLLFPDAKAVVTNPAMIQRKMAWVTEVINGTYHTPFSNIKSLAFDITADDARARGYVKGSRKTDEIVKALRRITLPTTIYKKQKLDNDDILDITDLDIVAWLKAEMRVMLDEELARAILIGDGRADESPDKINDDRIRPIYTDDEIYVERVQVAEADDAEDIIEAVIRARKNYNGSGNPAMFISADYLSDMLLLKDTTGRRLYQTKAELETVLMVSKIVEVPVMANVTRTTEDTPAVTLDLVCIIVNLKDYAVGANKGGQLGMFEDFDIDYNQHKYLIETRCSGALVLPKSAMVVEQVAAAG